MPDDAAREVQTCFGVAVRRLRIDRGWSQERLAEEAGIHPRYLSDLERGMRNVSIVNIDRLATAFGLSLSALMAETDASRTRRG